MKISGILYSRAIKVFLGFSINEMSFPPLASPSDLSVFSSINSKVKAGRLNDDWKMFLWDKKYHFHPPVVQCSSSQYSFYNVRHWEDRGLYGKNWFAFIYVEYEDPH